MSTRNLALFICIIIALYGRAQILPLEGAKLNYNQVMFEYEKVKKANIYIVQLAEDTMGASFGHYLIEQKDPATATMVSNLEFGKKYQWRYAGVRKGHKPVWHGPYHFEIVDDSMAYKHIATLFVTKNDSVANAGGLIVNDCTHTIVDRNGKLVWYLSNVQWRFILKKAGASLVPRPETRSGNSRFSKLKHPIQNYEVRPWFYDLRLTPYGTITYLEDSLPTETDLNCNVPWKAPNDGRVAGFGVESYNHDFKRLPNGNYMVLGSELWRKLPQNYDNPVLKEKYPYRRVEDSLVYARVEYGTIIEYDKKCNIVWSWNSHDYLDRDPFKPVVGNPLLDYELKPHMNAFSIDTNNQFVYAGLRNVSRIIKIDKKTGEVVNSWGEKMPSGEARNWVNLHKEHDANLLADGTIAVFNNNDYPNFDSLPSVVIISQQAADSNSVIWQYTIDLDSVTRRLTRNGGNVDQLKNGDFLVCLGNLDRILEVTRDKKIVWDAKIKVNATKWANFSHRLYRAHYASSLYPCYFTFQTSKDTVKRRHTNFTIRMFNKGTENDSYSIKVSSASGAFVQQFQTSVMAPAASAIFKIKPGKNLQRGDKIEVSISSQTNPDFVRKGCIVIR